MQGGCDESWREDVFRGDVFKEKSCRKDVFSRGACKDQTHAGRIRLAELLLKV